MTIVTYTILFARNFIINSCYCPIYFALQNRQSLTRGTIGSLDNVLIENVNCLKSTAQPIIFNWQNDERNKIEHVTLSNITVHNLGTKAGGRPQAHDRPNTRTRIKMA